MEEKVENTTKIINNDNFIEDEIIIDELNYEKFILDFEVKNSKRIELLERYFKINNDNTIELISRIFSMYAFSGTKILQQYLISIATESNLSSFLKIEAIKGLLSFEEYEEDIKDDDEMIEIKKESNEMIRLRNKKRKEIGYECLNTVIQNLKDNDLATPYKIDVICMLMENSKYDIISIEYFKNILRDYNLDSEYRYKTILSLEKRKIYSLDFHLQISLNTFLMDENNDVSHRVLSAQYILQKKYSANDDIFTILFNFAENEKVLYNLRADATDVILTFGNDKQKKKAQNIIMMLGGNKSKNLYENKQNIHNTTIESSIVYILEQICYLKTIEFEGEPITYETVSSNIQKLYKDAVSKENKDKIEISLNRIQMDRRLYSTLNLRLEMVLIKIWSYMKNSNHFDEMKKRLLEELIEMSGTCSSGYAGRLVNIVSGFSDFNIKVSFEDQIISNFSGRLNSFAKKIDDVNSRFRKEDKLLSDVKKILKRQTDKDINDILDEFKGEVLSELTISSSQYDKRPCFLLFFRTYMSEIREELRNEFIEYVTETDFDLYFRKALSYYDGIKDIL